MSHNCKRGRHWKENRSHLTYFLLNILRSREKTGNCFVGSHGALFRDSRPSANCLHRLEHMSSFKVKCFAKFSMVLLCLRAFFVFQWKTDFALVVRALAACCMHATVAEGHQKKNNKKHNIPKYSKIFKNISKHFGIFRNILKYFEIFQHISTYFGIFWNISEYFGTKT